MHTSERPRSVGPARAAAFLYGDWGTSKAYVLGIAFGVAGFSSFPILCAMAVLTALVGLNYYWVCKFYPDGGGVYSAVRDRSRMIASIGALLLIADYLVTASLSVLEGVNYISHLMDESFGVSFSHANFWAIGLIGVIGLVNWYGPRHSGTLAVFLAIPAAVAAASIAVLAIPYLGEAHFEVSQRTIWQNWFLFAGIVLALSGVEAVSNMTGVMVPDKTLRADGHVTVKRTSALTIGIVATEVVLLTIVLAWAMHAVPILDQSKTDAMLGQMASYFGERTFAPHGEVAGVVAAKIYASAVGLVMALLLFSAGNTALVGMISIYYMMSKDQEMPIQFGKLNKHGVPYLPLILSTALPCVLLVFFRNTESLASLYAIGVVGAITINLSACSLNKELPMRWYERGVMAVTSAVMVLIWVTIGYTKHDALIFAVTILGFGLLARSFVQERRQTQGEKAFREMLDAGFTMNQIPTGSPRILVALRGVTETLAFAIEEAQNRKGRLGVLFIREVKTLVPAKSQLENDPFAMTVFEAVQAAAGDVPVDLIYRVADDVPETIVQVIQEYQANWVVMGAPAGKAIASVLRGSMATSVANHLPLGARLLIYSWNSGHSVVGKGALAKK